MRDLPLRPSTLDQPGADLRTSLAGAWRDALVEQGDGSTAELAARDTLVRHDREVGVRSRFAGRVLVLDDDRLLVFQYSRGRIVLPGGGCDPGETLAQGAIREVREETTRAATLQGVRPAFVLLHSIMPEAGMPRVQYAAVFRAELDAGPFETEGRPVLWLDAMGRAKLASSNAMVAAIETVLGGSTPDEVPVIVLP